MPSKISRNAALIAFPEFPLSVYNPETEDYDYFFPPAVESYTLALSGQQFRAKARRISMFVGSLMKQLGSEDLYMLGTLDLPWRYRESDHPLIRTAMDYLIAMNVGKKFNGGFRVSIQELTGFLPHIAQLTRRITVLSEVNFIDTGKGFVGNICQYGSLHISSLNENADGRIRKLIKKMVIRKIRPEQCGVKG